VQAIAGKGRYLAFAYADIVKTAEVNFGPDCLIVADADGRPMN